MNPRTDLPVTVHTVDGERFDLEPGWSLAEHVSGPVFVGRLAPAVYTANQTDNRPATIWINTDHVVAVIQLDPEPSP